MAYISIVTNKGKTSLFPFRLHCESSEAQSMQRLMHWEKISVVNGHAFPRGREVCKLLFKSLIVWLWNKNASFLSGKESFYSGWYPGNLMMENRPGPSCRWWLSRLWRGDLRWGWPLFSTNGGEPLPFSRVLCMRSGGGEWSLLEKAALKTSFSLPRTNGLSSTCMKSVRHGDQGSQNEASTDLIWRQPTSVWEGLDVFILFSAVTKKKTNKNPAKVHWDNSWSQKRNLNQDNAGYILSTCSWSLH